MRATSIGRLMDRHPVALGIVTFTTALVLVALNLHGTLAAFFDTSSTHAVRAVFPSTQQLRGGDEVRIDGVKVGLVRSMTLARGGRTTTVTMDVDNSSGPLYGDARAILRWRTVLGGAFYVTLER